MRQTLALFIAVLTFSTSFSAIADEPTPLRTLTEMEILENIRLSVLNDDWGPYDYANLCHTLDNKDAWTQPIFRALMNASKRSDSPMISWLLAEAPKEMFGPQDVESIFGDLSSIDRFEIIEEVSLFEPESHPDHWKKLRWFLERRPSAKNSLFVIQVAPILLNALKWDKLGTSMTEEIETALRKRIARSVSFLKAQMKNWWITDDAHSAIVYEVVFLRQTDSIHGWSPSVVESLIAASEIAIRTGHHNGANNALWKDLPADKQTPSVKKVLRDFNAKKTTMQNRR